MSTIATLVTQLIAKTENFIGPMQDAGKAVDRVQKKFETQAATFGMTARQAEIYKLAQQGANRAVIEGLQAQDRHITRLEQIKAAQDRAAASAKEMERNLSNGLKRTTENANNLANTLERVAIKAGALAAIEKGTRSFADAIREAHDRGEELDITVTSMLTGFGKWASEVRFIGPLIKNLASAWETWTGQVERNQLALELHELALRRLALREQELIRQEQAVAAIEAQNARSREAHNRIIGRAQDAVTQLRIEYENLGLTVDEIREKELRSVLERAQAVEGFIDEQIAIHRAISAYRELQEEQKRLADEAARIFDMTRTPLEKFAKEVERLRDLFERGLLDQDTFDRRMRQLEEERKRAEDAGKALDTKRPAEVLQTPAAIERRFAQSFRTPSATDPGLKLLKTAEHTLVDGKQRTQIQKQQLTELQQLNNSLGQFTIYGGLN